MQLILLYLFDMMHNINLNSRYIGL